MYLKLSNMTTNQNNKQSTKANIQTQSSLLQHSRSANMKHNPLLSGALKSTKLLALLVQLLDHVHDLLGLVLHCL